MLGFPTNKKKLMKRFIFFICVHTLIYLLKRIWKQEHFYSTLLNIFNQPLVPCQESGMTSGSWDTEGKCSELGGGVHQICIRNIQDKTPNFSLTTGQSDWSNHRGKDNHCVCLGAWSLYQAKKKNNKENKVLKCESIPKVALSTDYVSKFGEGWNKWNGLELNNQIKDGVEALVENCYQPDKNPTQAEELKKNYCDFASQIPTLQDTELYQEMC